MSRKSASNQRVGSALILVAFLGLLAAMMLFWKAPWGVCVFYALVSIVCFIFYAIDKAAATSGRRRVSERTLLLMGIVGGWPGAIIAQQVLRHKTVKRSFRIKHWLTVVANVTVCVYLNSPLAPESVRQLLSQLTSF